MINDKIIIIMIYDKKYDEENGGARYLMKN